MRTRISSPAGRRDGAWAATGAALVFAALGAAGCQEKQAPPPAAPPEVVVTSVVQQDVPIQMEMVGQTKGSQDVEIRARVEGFLEDVAFTEGSVVRKGQVLYRIDRKTVGGERWPTRRPTSRPPRLVSPRRRTTSTATVRSSRSRPSASRNSTTRSRRRPPRRRRSRRRRRRSRHSKLDLGYATVVESDRRPGRHDTGEGRQPGRARRRHAADDHLRARPDPLPRRHQRGRVPPAVPPRRGNEERSRRRAGPDQPRAGRRHRASASRAARRDRACG